jgi:hypothetical protein
MELSSYRFEGRQLSRDEYLRYEWVLGGVPQGLFEHEQVVGRPDAHDQCGYFLRVLNAGEETNRLIDPEAVPEDLRTFVDRLFRLKVSRSRMMDIDPDARQTIAHRFG